MIVALPVFRSRISPVFDFTHQCLLVEYRNGEESYRKCVSLAGLLPRERIDTLKRAGVNVLICGVVTGVTGYLTERSGIRVHGGVAGDVDKVLIAFRKNELDQACFRMPGCRRRRHRRGTGFGRPYISGKE